MTYKQYKTCSKCNECVCLIMNDWDSHRYTTFGYENFVGKCQMGKWGFLTVNEANQLLDAMLKNDRV